MKNILKSRVLVSSFALLLGSASSSFVSAASLADLTAEQISRDATLSYDSATGASTVVMAGFEPFENMSDLAGTAVLKSTGQAVSINGRRVSGGGVLDLTLVYTTDTNDPYDVRGYERGVFLSRDTTDILRYDNKIVECSENVTELTYDDTYGSGVPYGFLAGVYMAFPRYGGHRNTGRFSSGYRSPYGYSSGGYDTRGYVSSGYYDRGSSTRGHSANGRTRHGHNGSSRNNGRNTDNIRGQNDLNAVRDSNGHIKGATGRTGRIKGGPRRNNNVRGANNVRNGDNVRGSGNGRNGGVKNGSSTRHNSGGRVKTPQGLASMRSDTKRFQNEPTKRSPIRAPLITKNESPRPAIQSSSSQNAPVRVKTPRTRTERVRSTARNKDRNASSGNSSRSGSNNRMDRSVDRAFRRNNPRPSNSKRLENFYPIQAGYGSYSRPVSVSYKCVREERLTVHIPEDRLQAARFDGMTVLIASRDGQETPVYIPPNYIEGYQKARQLIGQTAYTPNYTSQPNVGYPPITK